MSAALLTYSFSFYAGEMSWPDSFAGIKVEITRNHQTDEIQYIRPECSQGCVLFLLLFSLLGCESILRACAALCHFQSDPTNRNLRLSNHRKASY